MILHIVESKELVDLKVVVDSPAQKSKGTFENSPN